MNNNDTAALICRVSTREQEDGYSLEAQERLLREHCERRSLEPIYVYSFSETASKYEQRKKFREFIKVVQKARIGHIVAEKVDRLSRSGSRDAVLIDEWIEANPERHVHFVKQSLDIHKHSPSTVKFVWNMHVAVAKHTADNLSEEVLKSADLMLKKGIWPTRTKTGYVRNRLNSISPVEPDPLKASLILQMFELYDTGAWSVCRLAKKMAELGLTNTQGRPIPTSSIHRMLQDPFYIGQMKFRDKLWLAVHKPIVSQSLFDSVQTRLRRSQDGDGASTYRKHDHLLRGMAVCGNCGSRLTWEIHGDRIYGYCRKHGKCPDRVKKTQDFVEGYIFEALAALRINNAQLTDWLYRALQSSQSAETESKIRRLRELKDTLTSLTKKSERLLELRLDGEFDRSEYEKRREQLAIERAQVSRRLDGVTGEHHVSEDRARIFLLAQGYLDHYKRGTTADRREVVTKVFESFEVSDQNVIPHYKYPFDLLVTTAKTTNDSKLPQGFLHSEPNFEKLGNGSHKQKSQPLTVGNPIWLAEWEAFRHSEVQNAQSLDSSRNFIH